MPAIGPWTAEAEPEAWRSDILCRVTRFAILATLLVAPGATRAFAQDPQPARPCPRAPQDAGRANGLQGSNTDFLLCAVSVAHQMPILTTDGDFRQYRSVIPLALHAVPAA